MVETEPVKFCFDSNIYIAYPNLFATYTRAYVSSIVIAELLAGAQDATRIKQIKSWRSLALRFDQFLVPDAEDWLQAGLTLQRLSQGSLKAGEFSPLSGSISPPSGKGSLKAAESSPP